MIDHSFAMMQHFAYKLEICKQNDRSWWHSHLPPGFALQNKGQLPHTFGEGHSFAMMHRFAYKSEICKQNQHVHVRAKVSVTVSVSCGQNQALLTTCTKKKLVKQTTKTTNL